MNPEVVAALLYGAVIGFMFGMYVEARQRSAERERERIHQQIESLRSEVYLVTRRLQMEPIDRVSKGV